MTRIDKTTSWLKMKGGVAAHMKNTYLKLVRDHVEMKKAGNAAVYKAVIR